MFCQVYSDLVMLAKSKKLGKSTLDMNVHYLELKMFLKELQHYPENVMNKDYKVFISEAALYGNDEITNYRCRLKWQIVFNHLFTEESSDDTLLFPLIVKCSTSMELKLSCYAQNQLPGGIYWDAPPEVKSILEDLEPSNDICESVLGLNDYLDTALPNMSQSTRTNLIEVKKNKTIKWLDELPIDEQHRVLDLAVERRSKVMEDHKDEEKQIREKRREHLIQAHEKRLTLQKRAQQKKDKLSQFHLITTPQELYEALEKIDMEKLSAAKTVSQKLGLLRTQVNIRKKVLKQDIRIVFTRSRKQRPVIEELSDFIGANQCEAIPTSPSSLIGRSIRQRFELEGTHEEKWYNGMIVDYSEESKLFEVVYEEDSDHYFFDLYQDIVLGDLVIS